MKLKNFIFIFILSLLVLNIMGCSIQQAEDEGPVKIDNAQEAAQGGDEVVDGLDDITSDLDEIEDIVK